MIPGVASLFFSFSSFCLFCLFCLFWGRTCWLQWQIQRSSHHRYLSTLNQNSIMLSSFSRISIRQFSVAHPARFAKMTIIGTIGTDLQKQTTSTGKDYLKYSIAVNSKTKNGDTVSWFNIACFAPHQIEFMEKNLGKGSKIYLEADAKNTSYEKEDGTKAMSLMLFQSNFEVIKYPKKEEESQ